MADISLHLPSLEIPLLSRIRKALHQRRLDRELRLGSARLAALSPHLLSDVGLPPEDPERQISLVFGRT